MEPLNFNGNHNHSVVGNGAAPDAKDEAGVAPRLFKNPPTPAPNWPAKGEAGDRPRVPGIPEAGRKSIYEQAFEAARQSGDIEPREEMRKTVEEWASESARESHRDGVNSELYPHDRMRAAEYEKHLRRREVAEEAEMNAAAEVREGEKRAAAAAVGDPPAPPDATVWWVVGMLSAVAIGVSIVLTLQETFFASLDPVISWYVSFVAGVVVGLAVVLLIMADDDSEHPSSKNWLGLASAALIGVAFGGARMRDAVEFNDYLFAATLGLLEVGVAVGLFGVAGSRRRKLIKHSADAAAHAAKVESERRESALLAANVAELERCRQRTKELDDAVRDHILYCEERDARFRHIDEAVEASVASALAGYEAGVAANRAYVLGANGR